MSYQVAYPYHVDTRGRTATADDERHLRDLVEQVLFTTPGERIHRPDFGCGLLQLAFEPAGEALAETVRMTVQGALQRWLGERIQVDRVTIEHSDGTLRVGVTYRPRTLDPTLTGAARTATFEREI